MSEILGHKKDVYLDRIKKAKKVPAVAKTDFATFASGVPDNAKLFAYEGPADKYLYYCWIKRVQPTLYYEPYICGNKSKALQLYDLLKRDRTGLGDRAYFFIDHDFDGLQGRADSRKIFVTDKYSIENYLVCGELLDDLLTVDFHCHGFPQVRTSVRKSFEAIYIQFLNITKDLNIRIFAARTLSIRQIGDLPEKLKYIANVNLTDVFPTEHLAQDLVSLSREPTEEEWIKVEAAFASINPVHGYRGKFALQFLVKWLELLRTDRSAIPSVLFSEIPITEFSVKGDFTLQTLASKAPAPSQLASFLSAL